MPPESPSKPKPRPSRRTTGATPSPTRSLEPGTVHYRIAGGILKGLRERAHEAGIELDVGTIPTELPDEEASTEDPERLTRIVARIVARTGDRFSFVRKVSRHFEGTDRRAGVLSDVAAALTEIYKRNPDTVEQLAGQTADNFKARREQRAAERESKKQHGGVANASG